MILTRKQMAWDFGVYRAMLAKSEMKLAVCKYFTKLKMFSAAQVAADEHERLLQKATNYWDETWSTK